MSNCKSWRLLLTSLLFVLVVTCGDGGGVCCFSTASDFLSRPYVECSDRCLVAIEIYRSTLLN